MDIGSKDENELCVANDGMVMKASASLSKVRLHNLKNMVCEFKNIFRTRLVRDPPVDVDPMVIEFEVPKRSIKVRQRRYSPEQSDFLKNKVNELVAAGFVYRNNNSKWACAPVVVPKPGKEGFRFTADLCPVNAQTKKVVWPIPNPEAMFGKVIRAKVWFKLDFLHGYLQFPLEEGSRECQSFHTPFGAYTPYRVMNGATNSVAYFQSSMDEIFDDLDLPIYLDDILGYSKDIDRLFWKFYSVFARCKRKGLKLNPIKCKLIMDEVQFCGRIINEESVNFHLGNLKH